MPYLLVLTTVSTSKEAHKLADFILRKRFAACVQISLPVESHYWWKGSKEKSREVQLWIKTKVSAYSKLEKEILKKHPYAVPEIIAVPILKGSRAYLKWLSSEVR